MQLCNSGREFKVLFLVRVEAECKPPKPPKFGHLGLMGIDFLTPGGRRLSATMKALPMASNGDPREAA
jgi:hypothetical protein